MKKNFKKEYLNRDEVNEMIESALRRHNRRSTIISIIIITSTILIKSFSKDKKTSLIYSNQEQVSYKNN